MLLAPVVIGLGFMSMRRGPDAAGRGSAPGAPIPWFVLGFIAVVALNSAISLPASIRSGASLVTTFLLSMALAAMGLETDIRKLRLKGMRPLLLGLAGSLFISCFSLTLIMLGL